MVYYKFAGGVALLLARARLEHAPSYTYLCPSVPPSDPMKKVPERQRPLSRLKHPFPVFRCFQSCALLMQFEHPNQPKSLQTGHGLLWLASTWPSRNGETYGIEKRSIDLFQV